MRKVTTIAVTINVTYSSIVRNGIKNDDSRDATNKTLNIVKAVL